MNLTRPETRKIYFLNIYIAHSITFNDNKAAAQSDCEIIKGDFISRRIVSRGGQRLCTTRIGRCLPSALARW